jgi:hypothetical protein
MAKKQYRYCGESKWMGLSGNAVLGLYCVPGSGKKITVHSVEIVNKNQIGFQTGAADTNAAAPVKLRIANATVSGGYSLTPSKMNSAAAAWPSTVQVKQRAIFTPTLINWNGSATYTDATVAAGDVTFTPGTGPAWIANEHRDAGRYFVGTSGNVGTYRIAANTTTALTLDPPMFNAVSTTGYVAEFKEITHHGVLKTCSPAIANVPVSSNGYVNQNFCGGTGSIFGHGNSADQQDIYIRANETLAVFTDTYINASLPMFVEATFIVEGTPNRTYQLSYFTYLDAQGESILSINNTVGSGKVVRLVQLSVSEVGTLDTPYFQVVPIGSIDPASFDDTDKQLTAVPTNSAHGALASNQAILFTNVPVIPSGVPISYIAEGAPAAATPRGFNYLNSKDFIGPVFMTYFPEAAAYKVPDTAFWTAGAPGTMGTHVSHEMSRVKGYGGAPIILREGESLGIVSGAETATGSTAIGISGFGAYEFSVTFSIESNYVPTVKMSVQLVDGSPVENAQVLLTTNTGATLPFQASVTIANSGTTATVTHNAHGLETGDKILIKGASHYQNNGVFTITVINANSYSCVLPSAPGSSPTGTIVATFVFLAGLTNASGIISMVKEFSGTQPVIGWARKSSGSPYYKTAPVTGAATSSSDSTFSALLIPDE